MIYVNNQRDSSYEYENRTFNLKLHGFSVILLFIVTNRNNSIEFA